MNTEYHWVKDGDFPKEEGEYWCWGQLYGSRCYADVLYYSPDLYELDNWQFRDYKNQNHGGFCKHDLEWGWCEYTDVICWTTLPETPEELKGENDDS